ncbi:DedA family protein [Zhihengliuella halotolerans]|uniref:Membrane protein DedA with SNARE-associated domain n=1 Tax=Zhihengliuella halotolerans TaxID=370736 RepID=A0A4Q8AA34_9MICC|nr:VTT domain-containing protein [Zhihengliuella halotolerans]RZU60511.1 membrane protein DedA with SNARE-associated domain [Zhihengliuella halotolerans]
MSDVLGGNAALYYLITAFLVAFDAPFPPVPSELFVLGSGPMVAAGHLNPVFAWVAAAGGCWLGDMGLYWVFRRGLTTWLERFRWGRWVHRNTVALMNRVGRETTYASLLGLRFVSGGRTASVAAAGLAGVTPGTFAALAGLGAGLWAAWMMLLGYLTQTLTGWPTWSATLLSMGLGALLGLALAAVLARSKRRTRT